MLLALILFLIAAIGGATQLGLRLAGKSTPMTVGLLHGALAAAGLVALAIQVLGGHAPGTLPMAAFVLLVLAALGGFAVSSFRLRQQPIPIPFALVHAAIAVSGVVCLVLAVIGR